MIESELKRAVEEGNLSVTVDDIGDPAGALHVYLSTDILSTEHSYLGTELRSDEAYYQGVAELLAEGKLVINEADGVVINLGGELAYTQYLSYTDQV